LGVWGTCFKSVVPKKGRGAGAGAGAGPWARGVAGTGEGGGGPTAFGPVLSGGRIAPGCCGFWAGFAPSGGVGRPRPAVAGHGRAEAGHGRPWQAWGPPWPPVACGGAANAALSVGRALLCCLSLLAAFGLPSCFWERASRVVGADRAWGVVGASTPVVGGGEGGWVLVRASSAGNKKRACAPRFYNF